MLCRYSLPVNFQAVALKPHRKSQKKLTEVLNQMYGHLDSKYLANEANEVSREQRVIQPFFVHGYKAHASIEGHGSSG